MHDDHPTETPATPSASTSGVVLDTVDFTPPSGPVRAHRDGGVLRARGIPYGVAGRFEAPVAAPDRGGLFDAAHPSPACPQGPVPFLDEVLGTFPGELPGDEDCLNLSITLPGDVRAEESLPVMVWIHGGSYVSGAGDLAIMDPRALVAEQRVIVVSVTYRLGLFGYLGTGQRGTGQGGTRPEAPDARPANLGLLDQLEALRWVRRNIGAFGGDPETVTAFGQSAGGDAVAHLMALPEAPTLFRRAIVQSAPLGISRGRAAMSAAMNAALAAAVVEAGSDARANARTGDGAKAHERVSSGERESVNSGERESVNSGEREGEGQGQGERDDDRAARPAHPLATMPAEQVVALQERVASSAARFGLAGGMPFGTQYGLAPLPAEDEVEAAWNTTAPGVELLIGHTSEEARLFVTRVPVIARLAAVPLVGTFIRRLLVAVATSAVYGRSARRFAARHRRAGGAVRRYVIDWAAPGNPYGSAHTVDLPLLFGDEATWARAALTSGASWASLDTPGRAVRAAWAAFARGELPPAALRVPHALRIRRA